MGDVRQLGAESLSRVQLSVQRTGIARGVLSGQPQREAARDVFAAVPNGFLEGRVVVLESR